MTLGLQSGADLGFIRGGRIFKKLRKLCQPFLS